MSDETKMQQRKWEYKGETIYNYEIDTRLGTLGTEGWELCSAFPESLLLNEQRLYCLFKREIL